MAYPDEQAARKIRSVIVAGGFTVGGTCTSGAQALALAERFGDGGVVVCGFHLTDMSGPALFRLLPEGYEMVLLLHACHSFFEGGRGILSLNLPINRSDLWDTLHAVFASAAARGNKPQRSGEARALIQSAKELLMARNHLSEMQAHRYLQKKSMDTGKRLEETARMILQNNS